MVEPLVPAGPSENADSDRPHAIGVTVNGALAVLKIAGGLLSGSPSLLADGYHSLADLGTGAVGWISARVARQPPDENHHYGHGKIEVMASLGVGSLLVWTGIEVVRAAWGGQPAAYTGGELGVAVGVALVSMVANEWLAWITRRAAEATGSSVLRALARDNRSDSLTSVLVLAALGGAAVGWSWAEPTATVAIGILIGVMGGRSLIEAYHVLSDRVPDPELRRRIQDHARGVAGVLGVQSVRVHPLGRGVRVDMEISVDGDWTVRKGHAIAHAVEGEVTRREEDVVQVQVHVNPALEGLHSADAEEDFSDR